MKAWTYILAVTGCIVTSDYGGAGAQQAPNSPLVRAFGDNNYWIVAEEMTWTIGNTSEKIVIPKGFVTDFASIPQSLWSLGLSPQGRYSRAAVVHDYLYWSQSCTRSQADRLLVIAMKESQVGKFDEVAIYEGVNTFGASAWNSNRNERNAGLPKIVPENYLRPDDPNVTWDPYRKILVKAGVKDPPFPQTASYCAYGNSTNIP
jgi:Protein of unknown function (DUF1353)